MAKIRMADPLTVRLLAFAASAKRQNNSLLLYPLIKDKTLCEEFLKHASIN